jgi:hypothetical protein
MIMELNTNSRDFKQLINDVALIKNLLMAEGELTNWARKELDEARKLPDSENISLEKAKTRILGK